MATMYETIMNMPLFKGLSFDQVSAFVEKTHLEFKKYSPGDKIVSKGEEPKGVKCVVSGRLKVVQSFGENDSLKIVAIMPSQIVIGVERLFGMNTRYNNDIYAQEAVSIMEFSKEQYVSLISSNKILLLNYLNYLALLSQRTDEIYSSYPAGGVKASFSRLISSYVSWRAESLELKFNWQDMASFLNMDIREFDAEIKEMEKLGILTILEEGICINDKEMFMSF